MKIMTLREYRNAINSKELDKYADYPVVTAVDDEGNGHNAVFFTPSVYEDNEYPLFIANFAGTELKKCIILN